MSRRAVAGMLVVVLASVVAGCGPNLKAADGTRVSLHDYDSVSIKSVDLDPSVPYPGLPRQLSGAILGKLYLSKMWAMPGGTYWPYGVVKGENTSRAIDLRVLVLAAHYPSKGSRVVLGSANTMLCRMEVFDQPDGTLLGTADVFASKGPMTHGLLGGGVMGVVMNLATDMPEINELLLNDEMARAVVKVLDRAKRYQGTNGGRAANRNKGYLLDSTDPYP